MNNKAENEKYNVPFASRLRSLIEKNNVTISSLAKHIGITRQAVSQYCDGSTQPNADTIFKISRYFNVSADYLLGISEVPSVDVDLKAICDENGPPLFNEIQERVNKRFEKMMELVVELDSKAYALLDFGYSMAVGANYTKLCHHHYNLRAEISKVAELVDKIMVEDMEKNPV